jgi:HPt (histidine-containing phosphotransfer) domain-containing protein
MGESDLLEMLATETDRRTPTIVAGVKKLTAPAEGNAEDVEAVRVEAHGLKGAAKVVGQQRLGELAQQMEIALVQCTASGTIEQDVAADIISAAEAFQEGVKAAAKGKSEPKSVGKSLAALSED